MKIIREGVFETNSSSSHSIVIKKRVFHESNIPLNLDNYIVSEMGDVSYSEEQVDIDRHYTQVDKLRFVLNMLASVCEHLYNDDKMFKDYNYDDSDCHSKEYMDKFWNEMISSVYFRTLQDLVFEETGTHITFERPTSNYIPFYDAIYSEDQDVEDFLNIDEDNFDVDKFKKRLKEIIFDEDMVIINANIPYGCEGDWDV